LLSLILSRNAPRLKILHVASGDLWGGAEAQACTLLCALQDNNEVRVAAALLNEGELAARLRARNIDVFIFPENRLNGMQIMLGLRKLMRRWQPDVVHTHRAKENILGAIANRLSGNVPSVRTAHGASEHLPRTLRQMPRYLQYALDHWVGAHLQQKTIAVSQDLREKLRDHFRDEQLVVIQNGVDVDAVRAQAGRGQADDIDPDAHHIGIVGRLVPVKRVDLFLDMAARLRAERPDDRWQFHVFGDGPLHDTLAAQTRRLGIADITTFHGHCRDIAPRIAGLDALVMCSDHEGLPMTILEAMALGVGIVAHALESLVDALRDYARAQLVHDHDAAGYAAGVVRALTQPSAAATFDAERFSAAANARAITRLYSSLAAPATP
jgi:glycosyltransferase involved in cell wall biosynthesis